MRKLFLLLLFVAVLPLAADDPKCPAQWAYCGYNGPSQWKNLPDSKCGGTAQSPVAIKDFKPGSGPRITVEYADGGVVVMNRGYDIAVVPSGANQIRIEGDPTPWPLVNFHFHVPSEHYLGTTRFPAELHVVHKRGEDYVVIAILLRNFGPEDNVFSPVFAVLPKNICKSTSATVKLSELLPKVIHDYYTYHGSLTTPPCTERVRFYIVNGTWLRLSNMQFADLEALGDNARPLQDFKPEITLVGKQ